jgi:hypothetical protein
MILAGYLRQMQFHMLTERRKINGDSADAGARRLQARRAPRI